jgi:dihydropteroate synthase
MRSVNTFLRDEDNHFSWNLNGKLFTFEEPKVVGIINCTPDSFWESSRKNSEINIGNQLEKHILEGADVIDIGAYSSRPNATHITEKEEIERLKPAFNIFKKFPNTILSIDTFRSEVAAFSLENGAHIINDISAGKLDKNMFKTVAKNKAALILMHMKGTPQTMNDLTSYDSMLTEIHTYFSTQIAAARTEGVIDFALDLGFGFAKNVDQNFTLLSRQNEFKLYKTPILTGISRKSMISKTLGIDASDALNGTTALHMLALQNGASLLRVHDVKEAKQVVALFQKLKCN